MNLIKKYRFENDMTQNDLAQKMNVTQRTISMYENNHINPSIKNLIKLSEILNVTVDQLLNRKNYTPEPPPRSDETNNETNHTSF